MSEPRVEDALNTVSQLPTEQQAMLVEIIQNRLIETRLKEIAQDAKVSLAAFHRGEFQSQLAETAILELQKTFEKEHSR
ncbi:MAG: hypothetical protein ACFBSF_04330 [Leptolyngbyaceae cyanobacterium]